MLQRRALFAIPLLALLPRPARALDSYTLDLSETEIAFNFNVLGALQRGRLNALSADIGIDFADLSRSRLSTTLDAASVRTGNAFVDQTVHSRQMLDSRRFSQIRFVAAAITGSFANAAIRGPLQIKSESREIVLRGGVFRPREQLGADFDRSSLIIRLNGAFSRAAYGLVGFPDIVADQIGVDIRARLRRV